MFSPCDLSLQFSHLYSGLSHFRYLITPQTYTGIGDQIRGTAMGSLGGSAQEKHAALAASGRNEFNQGMSRLQGRSS